MHPLPLLTNRCVPAAAPWRGPAALLVLTGGAPSGVLAGEQFQQLMTPAEKAKLYDAIGYQENAVDPTLPKDVGCHFYNRNQTNLSELTKYVNME